MISMRSAGIASEVCLTFSQAREQIVRHALGADAAKVKEKVSLVRNRLVAVNGEINNPVGSLAKFGADAVDFGEREAGSAQSQRQ